MGVAQGDRYKLPQPVGAGRLIDQRWPSDLSFRANGSVPSGAVIDRLGATDPQSGTLQQLNANAGFNANFDGQGWSGATIGATVANSPNGMRWAFQGMVAQVAYGMFHRGIPAVLNGISQLNAYRFIAEIGFSIAAPLAANIDNGPFFATAGGGTLDDGGICLRGTPGLGFRCSDVNTIQAVSRGVQAGTLTLTPLTVPVGFDHRDLHAYELRLLGANGNTNAQAKWYIDGQLVLSRFWGGAITMPTVNSNNAGFKVFLESNGGNALGFACRTLHFHGASNEDNLL